METMRDLTDRAPGAIEARPLGLVEPFPQEASGGGGLRKFCGDVWLLLRRSIREGLRNPAFAFLFPAVFPLFIIVLTSQTFRNVIHLPGFPDIHPYAAYEAPAVLFLTAMMGAGYSATGLVVDSQSGFLD